MASSEHRETKNDREVRNFMSENDVSQGNDSKCLSPILGGSSISRRYLEGRRLRGRKSRVKLSDRFKQDDDSSEGTCVKDDLPQFTEDSFTFSQKENIIKQIERLEEIENNRNKIYSMIVAKNKENECCFRKPASPPLNKAKKAKIEVDTSESDTSLVECRLSNISLLPSCTGFRTAKGEDIEVSESDIKKHSKIFEDVLFNPGMNQDSRKNKYSFLSKSKSEIRVNDSFNFNIKLASSQNDVSSNPSRRNCKQTKFDPYIVLEGVKNDAVPIEKVWERPNTSPRQYTRSSDMSLTQQICESGISNTQMLRAADEALTTLGNDPNFSGFSKEECMMYENIFEQFINVYRTLQRNRKCSKKSIFSMTANTQNNDIEAKKSDIIFVGKRLTDDLPLPPTKRIKSNDSLECIKLNIENKENNVQASGKTNFCGFTSASGKSITVSNGSLKKARSLFDDIDDNSFETNNRSSKKLTEVQSKTSILDINNIPKAPHVKHVLEPQNETNNLHDDISLNSIKRVESKTSIIDVNVSPRVPQSGFISASAKCIATPEDSLEKTTVIFDNLNKGLPVRNVVSKTSLHGFNTSGAPRLGFHSASGKLLTVSDTALKTAKTIFEHLDVDQLKEVRSKPIMPISRSCQRLQSRSKMEILEPIPESSEGEDVTPSKKPDRNHTVNRVQATVPRTPKNIFADFDLSDLMPLGNKSLPVKTGFQSVRVKPLVMSKESLQQQLEKHVEQTKKNSEPPISEDYKPKKRLGMSSCRLLPISNTSLEKARMLFEEDISKLSPLKPAQSNLCISTPSRQNIPSTSSKVDVRPSTAPVVAHSTPIRSGSSRRFTVESPAMTPIKPSSAEGCSRGFPSIPDQKVVLTSPTKGNVEDWMIRLQEDREKLEYRLTVILERQKLMEGLAAEKSEEDKRPREGVLFRNKARSNRMTLEFFVDNKRPGEESVNYELFEINPENAAFVHFKDQTYSALTTQDGAVIIPNFQDVVGLSEITAAIEAMPGVDPRLIPRGWIRNHYKWVIWKLTSYARMFPNRFGNCLNVENVVQQLKYRYDREIDKAERSALRRIYEKDDAPQKRLILCVSNITEVNPSRHELELTDGWYSIRTVIDELLNKQTIKQKIQIGTKLLISGAQLLNCDGCYPLETTHLTCLKIHYNSTRRAHWNSRLGYQSSPEPFPIPIHCVHPSGGPIGAIKVCIVRTYPFKYLEKLEGRSVWRNKKAEERRAQQWENERHKKLEAIRDSVIHEFEIAHLKQKLHSKKPQDQARASSPTMTLQLSEYVDGPDGVNLTKMDYRDKLSVRMQQQIAERIKEHVSKVKLPKRDVTEVFKLLVTDMNGSADRGYSFFVWRPGEEHLQMLREGTVVTVRNILPKKNGDLNSTAKTTFKHELPVPQFYNCFKRRLSEIAELTRSSFLPLYGECDTVGLVIQLKVDSSGQEVWLADRLGRLLVIKSLEGSSTCLLLDKVKRGQITTVSNLRFRGITETIPQAIAGYFTVFSCYSQHKHLQEGLEMLKEQLPKDLSGILSECDRKIELFKTRHNSRLCSNSDLSSILDDDDESTLTSSRLTSTDVALSLIDMDQYT